MVVDVAFRVWRRVEETPKGEQSSETFADAGSAAATACKWNRKSKATLHIVMLRADGSIVTDRVVITTTRATTTALSMAKRAALAGEIDFDGE
jgi:hypothetical protein